MQHDIVWDIHIWGPAMFIRIVMDFITDDSFWKISPFLQQEETVGGFYGSVFVY